MSLACNGVLFRVPPPSLLVPPQSKHCFHVGIKFSTLANGVLINCIEQSQRKAMSVATAQQVLQETGYFMQAFQEPVS